MNIAAGPFVDLDLEHYLDLLCSGSESISQFSKMQTILPNFRQHNGWKAKLIRITHIHGDDGSKFLVRSFSSDVGAEIRQSVSKFRKHWKKEPNDEVRITVDQHEYDNNDKNNLIWFNSDTFK